MRAHDRDARAGRNAPRNAQPDASPSDRERRRPREQCSRRALAILASLLWLTLGASSTPAQVSGVCGDGVIDIGEQCDDANVVNGDCCSDLCQIEPSTVVCRPAAGICDVADSCDGVNPTCPADALVTVGTDCRSSTGACDPAEVCDGATAACPADALAPSGTTCRSSTGACDPAEVCDGATAACPADALAPSGTTCRTSAGGCDPAEVCDGTGATCPADSLFPSGSICRSTAGACDAAEICDGSSPACPTDGFTTAGTTCRIAAGACDVAETCTGAGPDCPVDLLAPADTTCRLAGGACDVAEVCSGSSSVCPADTRVAAGTSCRPTAGPCDIAETCDGVAANCPADARSSAGTICRVAANVCDAQETCDGTSTACPTDALRPDGASCNDADVCSSASICQTGACVGTTPTGAGQVCRPLAGPCDIAETCDGVAPSCPSDGYRPATALCRAEAGSCDQPETCTGTGVSCPSDQKRTTQCRPAASECDVPEYCDGASNACGQNLFMPNGTFCNDEGNPCTRDVCSVGSCTHPVGNTGALCRAALDTCDLPETCDGISKTCPTDLIVPDETACSDGQSCTAGDQCSAGRCEGVSLTCGNGVVECGETCDDGNTVSGDECSPTCQFEEICTDFVDNEPDGRLDCFDQDCSEVCGSFVNGGVPSRPSRIIFKRSLDMLRVFGAILPRTTFDPTTERFGIAVSNSAGVLFSAAVPPGGLGPRGETRWVLRDPAARLNGGIFSASLKREETSDGTVLRFVIVAFGEFSAATDASMSIEIAIGDDAAVHTTDWTSLGSGWRVELP